MAGFMRFGMTIGAAAAGLAAVAAAPAGAAEMRVATSAVGAVIMVSGEFQVNDGDRFAKLSAGVPKAMVVFNSPGGNLFAGLKIGDTIRAHGYATLVPDNSLCTSACAIAWMGGKRRLLGSAAKLGFHAAYYDGSGLVEISSSGNALVGAYYSRLGLSSNAILALTNASPIEMQWIGLTEMKTLGVAVESYTGPAFGPPILTSRDPAGPRTIRTAGGTAPGYTGNGSGPRSVPPAETIAPGGRYAPAPTGYTAPKRNGYTPGYNGNGPRSIMPVGPAPGGSGYDNGGGSGDGAPRSINPN